MSRPQPSEPGAPPSNLDDLEELGDDAIIAQQTDAHLPQKRIVVAEEERSVVISEGPPPVRPLRSYRVERGEPTVVIRDRSALEKFRAEIVEQRRRLRGNRHASYLWAGVALAAFAMGGLLTFVLMGDDDSANGSELGAATSTAVPARAERVAPQPARAAPPRETEAPPPQVKLEELPVERPRRR